MSKKYTLEHSLPDRNYMNISCENAFGIRATDYCLVMNVNCVFYIVSYDLT